MTQAIFLEKGSGPGFTTASPGPPPLLGSAQAPCSAMGSVAILPELQSRLRRYFRSVLGCLGLGERNRGKKQQDYLGTALIHLILTKTLWG